MAKISKDIMSALKGAGFTDDQSAQGEAVLLEAFLDEPETAAREADINDALPLWSVQDWRVVAAKKSVVTKSLVLELNVNLFKEAIAEQIRLGLGRGVEVEFRDKGIDQFWVLVESKGAKRKGALSKLFSRNGAAGFLVSLTVRGDLLYISTTQQFSIGSVPERFLVESSRYVMRAVMHRLVNSSMVDISRHGVFGFALNLSSMAHSLDQNVYDLLGSDRHRFVASMGVGKRLQFICGDPALDQDRDTIPHRSLPLEQLESIDGAHLDVDEPLLDGKLDDLVQFMANKLQGSEEQTALARRAALIQGQDQPFDRSTIEALVAVEPGNLSFLSCMARHPAASKEQQLDRYLQLGEALLDQIPDAENLQCLEYVLPERLGHLWWDVDIDRAESCYSRIVQRRGGIPEVLLKLAEIASKRGELEKEITYLDQLAGESLPAHLASQITLQRMRLKVKVGDRAAATRMGVQFHACRPDDVTVTKELVDLIIKDEDYLFALDILSHSAQSLRDEVVSADLSHIEALIGTLWLEGFGRLEKAEKHLTLALDLDDTNEQAMLCLEKLYRQMDEPEKLAKVLNDRYRLAKQMGADEDVRSIKRQIIDLYTGELSQFDKAFDIYLNASEDGILEPEEIARLLDWDVEDVEWERLYQLMLKGLDKVQTPESLGMLHANLAEIARKKMNNAAKAIKHLKIALAKGVFNPGQFDFLKEALRSSQAYEDLIAILESRLASVQDHDERLDLMRELDAVPAGLSDEKRDHYATELYLLNTEDKEPLYKRFHHYAESEHILAIDSLADAVIARQSFAPEVDHWLAVAIDMITNMNDDRRFATLDKLLRHRVSIAVDKEPVLQSAVNTFYLSGSTEYLPYFCQELIERGAAPNLEFGLLVSLLKPNSLALAKVLDRRAQAEQSSEEAGKFFLEAFQIYSAFPGEEFNAERCLASHIGLVETDDATIHALRDFAEQSGHWRQFADALSTQVNLCSQSDRLSALLQDLASVYEERLSDFSAALEVTERLVEMGEDSSAMKFVLADIAYKTGDVPKIRKALVGCLEDDQCVREVDRIRDIMQRLLQSSPGIELDALLLPHIERFGSTGEAEIAGRLSDLLIGYNHDSRLLREASFIGALYRFDPNDVGERWVNLLAAIDSKGAVQGFVEWSRGKLDDAFVDVSWDELAAFALESESIDRLNDSIGDELRLSLALDLFSSDNFNDMAFRAFRDHWEKHADDQRVWIPFYLLLREYGSDEEMLTYLEQVMPRLAEQPGLFDRYPITFESIRAEKRRLQGDGDEDVIDEGPSDASVEDTPLESLTAKAESLSHPLDQTVEGEDLQKTVEIESPQAGPSAATLTWKQMIETGKCEAGVVRRIMDRAFDNAVEKHVAVQSVALLAGEVSELHDWQWQVWRDPDQYGYHRSGRQRYPDGENPRLLNGDLHKLIKQLSPAMVRIYREEFSLNKLARQLRQPLAFIENGRRELDWSNEIFMNSALKYYLSNIQKQKFKVFSLEGMHGEIFYEGETRTLYLDAEFYRDMPGTILFHKIFGLLWSVKLNYFIPLHLDPVIQVMPVLNMTKDAIAEKGLQWFVGVLSSQESPIAYAMNGMDKERVARLFERVGSIDENMLQELWFVMQEHVYRLLLAEMLDVVGLFESVVTMDLTKDRGLKVGDILELDPHFAGLLHYLTKLRF